MATKKRESLAEELAASPAAKACTGGSKCKTCTFEKREEVEWECQRWNEMRRDRVTHAPWKMLHAELRKRLDYPARSWKSLVAHLEDCLGWQVF